MISLVSTYKNRRHHIEQTFPNWLQQSYKDYEIVIVDYDTDDDLSEFFPKFSLPVAVKHIHCKSLPKFVLSHARNIGSHYVSGEWILFVDIDTYLSKNALKNLSELCTSKCYLAAEDSQIRKEIINGGLIMVKTKDHKAVCGFNEDLKGWGYEDIDYKRRLEASGLDMKFIPQELYTCINHVDTERTQCYGENMEITWTKNRQIALRTWSNNKYGLHDDIAVTKYV